MTFKLCHLKKKRAQLIKKRRYFSCKERINIAYDCLKKGKITTILEDVAGNYGS